MSNLALGHPSISQAVLDQLNVDPGVLGTPGCEGCTALSGLLQILLDALGETQRALGETQSTFTEEQEARKKLEQAFTQEQEARKIATAQAESAAETHEKLAAKIQALQDQVNQLLNNPKRPKFSTNDPLEGRQKRNHRKAQPPPEGVPEIPCRAEEEQRDIKHEPAELPAGATLKRAVQKGSKQSARANHWFCKTGKTPTTPEAIRSVLNRFKKSKEPAVRYLVAAWIALHNNDSEGALARYVKRCTLSDGAKNEHGRVFRDVLLFTHETYNRLKMPFADYLPRICKGNHVDLELIIRDVHG